MKGLNLSSQTYLIFNIPLPGQLLSYHDLLQLYFMIREKAILPIQGAKHADRWHQPLVLFPYQALPLLDTVAPAVETREDEFRLRDEFFNFFLFHNSEEYLGCHFTEGITPLPWRFRI